MSRVIVKNIPSYVTPDRLKKYFAQENGPGGTLTDVKVALKPDGTSRRFGFVGYKTEKEASRAREWFNRTYIDTTRISVDVVEQGARDTSSRPSKRPRLGPAPNDKPADARALSRKSVGKDFIDLKPGSGEVGMKTKKTVHLDEYLKVMQPRTKKGRSWANEDPTDPVSVVSPDLQSSKMVNWKQKPTDDTTENTTISSPDIPNDDNNREDLDDLEWMKRRMTKDLDSTEVDEEKAFQQDDDLMDEDPVEEINDETAEPSDPTKEAIERTSRLFVRNLAFTCTESDLQELFSSYGEIAEIHIPLDRSTKEAKGLAFVRFAKPTSAVDAYEALDKSSFQGRLIHILPAVDRPGTTSGDGNDLSGRVTVKGDKDKKRKAAAGKEFNWSMLYMNSDAVASSIADRMNITKSDILNPEPSSVDSTSAAVKLALAETHIIQETKTYLESEGIDLSSFSDLAPSGQRPRRSDTCILVKNIPYGTTNSQVREMFETHGELSRVLVPPAGTIAVVDFVHSDEAAKAFRAVAYRRLGSSIVYLEKAPLGVFRPISTEEAAKEDVKKKGVNFVGKEPVRISEQEGGQTGDDDEENVAAGSTLFIKNLSFATTSDRLTSVFRHLPSFAFGRVQTKPDPKAPTSASARLSMGYGFVGFKDPAAAKMAMKSMQKFVLDGHALVVRFAGRGADDVEEGKMKGGEKAKTTKMIVKNLPFEASKKDVRELFGAHGQLKSVRLPKKFDSRSRGFAFLDFVSRHEAENAYAALRHTHLLGRHLVLDWAEDEVDVDALRRRAGVAYGGGADAPGRKRKLELGLDDEPEGDE